MHKKNKGARSLFWHERRIHHEKTQTLYRFLRGRKSNRHDRDVHRRIFYKHSDSGITRNLTAEKQERGTFKECML